MDYALKVGSQVRATLTAGTPGTFSHRPYKITGTVERFGDHGSYAVISATDGRQHAVRTYQIRVIGN